MRIALCDDNKADLESLNSMVKEHPVIAKQQIDLFNSGSELLSMVQSENKYDIVFLDIDMPSINGIDIGRELNKRFKQSLFIFITSYPQYAVDAFDCEAFNYILKPCDKDKLFHVIDRALSVIESQNHFIIVKERNTSKRISLSELYYVEYCKRHVLYHMKDYVIEATGVFSEVYENIKNYGFYQIHQGYIVNLEKITDFENSSVVLENGEHVAISVRKKSEVYLQYAKYLERH